MFPFLRFAIWKEKGQPGFSCKQINWLFTFGFWSPTHVTKETFGKQKMRQKSSKKLLENYFVLWSKKTNETIYVLTIDQRVEVTRSFYQVPSISIFFYKLGGSMGLWLGIGITQICLSLLEYLLYSCKYYQSSTTAAIQTQAPDLLYGISHFIFD